jgi:hypothetical protein
MGQWERGGWGREQGAVTKERAQAGSGRGEIAKGTGEDCGQKEGSPVTGEGESERGSNCWGVARPVHRQAIRLSI